MQLSFAWIVLSKLWSSPSLFFFCIYFVVSFNLCCLSESSLDFKTPLVHQKRMTRKGGGKKESRRAKKRENRSWTKREWIWTKRWGIRKSRRKNRRKEKVERKGRGRRRRETSRRPGDLFCVVHPTPPEREQVRKREVHTPGVHFAGITCKKDDERRSRTESIQEARDGTPETRTRASFGNNQVLAYNSLLSCESFSPWLSCLTCPSSTSSSTGLPAQPVVSPSLHCFPLFLPLLPVHVPCIPGCYACLPSSSSPSLSRPSSSVILNLFPLLFLSCFSSQLLHVYLRQDNCLHWTCCWFCWFLQSFHFVCHHISWAVIFIEEGFLACPSRPYSSSSWFFLLILNQWLRKSNESWLLYGHLDWRQPVDCVSLVAAIYSRRTRLNFFSALLFFLLSAL